MRNDIATLKEKAVDVYGLTSAESSALVDYALGEIATPEFSPRRKRFPVQTCLWLSREGIEILELLIKLAKKNGQLAGNERKQDYLRNLVYREFLTI